MCASVYEGVPSLYTYYMRLRHFLHVNVRLYFPPVKSGLSVRHEPDHRTRSLATNLVQRSFFLTTEGYTEFDTYHHHPLNLSPSQCINIYKLHVSTPTPIHSLIVNQKPISRRRPDNNLSEPPFILY